MQDVHVFYRWVITSMYGSQNSATRCRGSSKKCLVQFLVHDGMTRRQFSRLSMILDSRTVRTRLFMTLSINGVREKIPRVFQAFSRATNLLASKCNNDLHHDHNDPVYPVNSSFTQMCEWWIKTTLFATIFSWGCTEFPEFSMFSEIPEYFRFSWSVATLSSRPSVRAKHR